MHISAMAFIAADLFSPRLRGLIQGCGQAGIAISEQLAAADCYSIIVLANTFDTMEEAVAGLERPGHLYGGPATGVNVGDLWQVAEAFCAQSARGGLRLSLTSACRRPPFHCCRFHCALLPRHRARHVPGRAQGGHDCPGRR